MGKDWRLKQEADLLHHAALDGRHCSVLRGCTGDYVSCECDCDGCLKSIEKEEAWRSTNRLKSLTGFMKPNDERKGD